MNPSLKQIKRSWLVRLKKRDLYCVLCGCLIESRKDLSVEHLVPRALGGKSTSDNIYPAHKHCNLAKGCHTPEEWVRNGDLYLESLIASWQKNKTRFNIHKISKSLGALR